MIYRHYISLVLGAFLMCSAAFVYADTSNPETLRKEALRLDALATDAFNNAIDVKQVISHFTHNRTISDASTQLAVYISLRATSEQRPSEISIEIKLGGSSLALNRYQDTSIDALLKGTTHRLFVGHVPPGSHDLIAHVKEKFGSHYVDSHGAIRFNKSSQPKVFEISISLSENDIPPEVVFLDHS